MASLQEQLMKAGMVDAKKAKQINKEKRKQAKKLPKGQQAHNETKAAAAASLAEKSERDRALEKQRQELINKKAIAAQIKQLIETNTIDRKGGTIAFQFADNKKIKKTYVTAILQSQLSKGMVAIASLGDHYHLIPAVVADKIEQRNDTAIVYRSDTSAEITAEDDPYADYQIPDDLMW